jgi:hypothetical protein
MNIISKKHRNFLRAAAAFAVASTALFFLPPGAAAQYAPGTMGSPGYGSSGKAIGIGVGAAAGGAGLLYLVMHHHGSLEGCVSQSAGKFNLTDGKGKTYSLLADPGDVKPGERLQLSGKKSTGVDGVSTFEVKKVLKDKGSCQ